MGEPENILDSLADARARDFISQQEAAGRERRNSWEAILVLAAHLAGASDEEAIRIAREQVSLHEAEPVTLTATLAMIRAAEDAATASGNRKAH